MRLPAAALVIGLLSLAATRDSGWADDRSQSPPPPGFVSTKGTDFVVDGSIFPVAGVNNHYLTYGTEEEVIRVLDDAVAMGANVVRTFLQPVIGSKDGIQKPTVWDFRSRAETSNLGVNGTFLLYWDVASGGMAMNEGPNGLYKVDFLMAEAEKRNLKVILALLDFWRYTGGAAQMSAWYGSTDPARHFPTDPRTIRDYKSWARAIITRKNTITGKVYAEDPSIFSWQLMNEPNFEPADAFRQWVVEMSSYIKSIDPHHLVSIGHGYVYYKFADLEIDSIDFGTWHGYPIHSGLSWQEINEKIDDLCAIGKRYGKPMLWEEFGYARKNPDQLQAYETWLETVERNRDCAGWIVWRLVSKQKAGNYPKDEYDQFDVRNDGTPLFATLKGAAARLKKRTEPSQPAPQ